ncbi:MAG: hypothetical protein KGI29_07170 [Pseudomonadota bacterium]|nr:hypothetical protein [Pseudomonadota bacterium]MDE3036872.1 hypothetical protein [Pseudomonadota bacterium]
MRLRTFTAPDMPAAMQQVRQALGDEAIILSTQPQRGRKGVQVTAAIEASGEWPVASGEKKKPSSPTTRHSSLATETEAFRFDLQHLLRFHNVPELFIARMMKQAEKQSSLEKFLGEYFIFEPINLDPLPPQGGGLGRGKEVVGRGLNHAGTHPHPGHPPYRGRENILMLVGPPGVGKTLTTARIAAQLCVNQKTPAIAVITTDNQRAGGIEQLQAFTSILGLDLHVAPTRAELWRHIQSQPKDMRILIDTAGCNPYDAKVVSELAAYGALEGVEPILVLPAGGDSEEAIDIAEAFTALPIRRLLVTRADTARRFGGVLSVALAHGLAFCNAGHSPGITLPLQPMNGEALAQYLLRYQLQNG